MKVLKPNGIFQALYIELQITTWTYWQYKKPARALLFFNFLY